MPRKPPQAAPSSRATGALVKLVKKAGLTPEQRDAVQGWMVEQLLAAEYANLGQGGHTEASVPLQRVFIDLPVSAHPGQTAVPEGKETFLAQLLAMGATALGPGDDAMADGLVGPCEDANPEMEPSWPTRHKAAGFLLIGGPGQGKSTLGQLACQIHRAALLTAQREALPHRAREVLDQFAPQADGDGSSPSLRPKAPLIPLAIPLPELSAWLANAAVQSAGVQEPRHTLLHFLCEQPSAKKCGLDVGALVAMVRACPTLLFLDGFDEVGSPEDRQRIVVAVQQHLAELREHKGRVQILATTRPQGYAGELGRVGAPLSDRYLLPLSLETAMGYAARLVQAKIQGADNQQKVLARLHEAAKEPATAHLMTSPLQVTILAALVQTGSAPRERWTLFRSFFDFTYRREVERDSYASRFLATNRGHIEQVHRRIALLLQVESEESGGAAARVSRERLDEITDTVLREDEFAEDARRDRVRQILDAAERRLVFLVEPEPGRFGFEIRSLQEFMAAWALSEGADEEITERLRHIAPAPMFRNVLLFVASRFFSETHRLRDHFAERLCPDLDAPESAPLLRLSRAGATLALEILEEGAALSQPKRARALMERAVGLLDLPPSAEHARLASVSNDDTRDLLLSALRERLAEGRGAADPLAAWACLTELGNRESARAVALWDEAWPQAVEPDRIVEAIGDVAPIYGWLAERLEASAERVSAESLVRAGWLFNARRLVRGWVGALLELGRPRRRIPKVMLLDVRPKWAQGVPPAPPPERWRPWCALVRFRAQPTATGLADTLSEIRATAPPESWGELAEVAAWPVAACLRWAETPADLAHAESLARAGALGDRDDWQQSETKWMPNGRPPTLAALTLPESEDAPWTIGSLQAGSPRIHMTFGRSGARIPAETLAQASRRFREARRHATRRYWAQLCLALLGEAPAQPRIPIADLASWLEVEGWSADWLVPRPRAVDEADWLALLLACPRDAGEVHLIVTDAIGLALAHPEVPWLLRCAVRTTLYVGRYPEHPVDALPQLAAALQAIRFEDPQTRVDAALLRLLSGEPEPALMDELATLVPEMSRQTMGLVLRALGEAPSRRRVAVSSERVLEAIWVHQAARSWRDANPMLLLRSVRGALQSQRSELGVPATWTRLGLPNPPPLAAASQLAPTAIPDAPIVLQSLEVQELRGLRNLSMEFAPPPEGEGQWTVLLGPNGAGKTTLLRALVLALRNLRDPAIWPRGVFSTPWIRAGAEQPTRILVRLGGLQRAVDIHPNGTERLVQTPEQKVPRLFPLFAYGCRRGSALGGTHRAVDTEEDGPEVATLFDEGAGLVHAETWLVQWEGDALKNVSSRVIYDAVCAALSHLLNIQGLEVKDRRLWILEHNKPRLPLESMSDGYLTTAGWFVDLVARWIDMASRHGVRIEGDFLQKMTGLVLLDEIDLHLHPLWQIEVIRRTRALLPRMSFVVTTHNPLTLVGARPEEIWMLSEREGEVVASQSTEAPMLLTGGQIFNRYFGIESVFPAEIGRKFNRYAFLSGYGARNDAEQEEMVRLREALRAVGVEPGWEEAPRAAIDDVDLSVFSIPPPKRKRKESP